MKYLKYFDEASIYEAYKNESDFVLPNVSLIGKDVVMYNPLAKVILNVFTINNTLAEFQFEEGMTWEDFVNSDYNNGKFRIFDNQVIYNDVALHWQTPSTVIENTDYTASGYGGQ